MKPNKKTHFRSFNDIERFSDKDEYFCVSIVFSPDTENDHFEGCPPYIELVSKEDHESIFFEVPEIIAYYGKVHVGYTHRGLENREKEGARKLQVSLKNLLNIQ